MDKVPTYTAIHQRLRYHRGPARKLPCAHCSGMAHHWAFTGEPKWYDDHGRPYTDDLNAYTSLCGSCHQRLDAGLPPCPHGLERDRLPDGTCRACFNERENVYRSKRLKEDPEYREAMRAKDRARKARGRSSFGLLSI